MSDKHKRNITENLTDDEIDLMFLDFKNNIHNLPPKQHILKEWFGVWGKYISFEYTFDPKRLVYYKRGDVVLAHFGYNIGSELGGVHYAIVVENNNNKSNNTVVVVPISSIADNREKPLHSSEVYLGEIIPNSGIKSYAMPMQIRAISKLRIIKPKTSQDNKITVSGERLTQIDDKIIKLYTKKS